MTMQNTFFKYCIKQDDGINKYFILNKDSPDFERLNKDYDIVPFGSFKHKINYLFSEKIMISQVTRGILNPFTHENNTYYEGLSTYKFCFPRSMGLQRMTYPGGLKNTTKTFISL